MTLPSWNNTQSKQAILDYVAAANDEAGPDYIPPAERIAAFDNDGTLWVEQPAPAQTGFLIGKLVEQVKANPALAEEDPYKGIITNVEPSIQAAFIDFGQGQGKNGFLHISDLHPQHFPNGEGHTENVGRKMPRRSRPPIQRCLRRGQQLLVQITKEGIGTKGATGRGRFGPRAGCASR